ncbi:MAG: MMPL family transporter [Erysipelotrichaceae bacterium]|nr:MMPL family transporter [Erysipelotrichaceae bacterium]MDY6034388.1 MMPL family transporter [Bulleidia sp.]
MKNFGKGIVKHRILILVISLLLLIPSVLGYINTRVNYDILSYLPSDIETMKGQDILKDNFGKGGFAIEVMDGMSMNDISQLQQEIEKVDGVEDVIWYGSIADSSIPIEALPSDISKNFSNEDSSLMAIFFRDGTSSDTTIQAVEQIRKLSDHQAHISGMSAVVLDIQKLSESEAPIYVFLAVILTCIIIAIFMDAWILPLFFMINIGMAILYNLGSNYFLGEISYITKALAAVLQLGVTLDYSIFLWHSYEEQQENGLSRDDAMTQAINSTLSSVVGSSTTTVAGFLALCFMSFTLGKDLGIVMAKGVVFGVIACVTILPSIILVFDRLIKKTKHKVVLPKMDKFASFVVKHYKSFVVVFLIILLPAVYGYQRTPVYYDLTNSLPDSLESMQANKELKDKFDMNATHMILASSDLSYKEDKEMLCQLEDLDGIKFVLGRDSLLGPNIPKDMLPKKLEDTFESHGYQLIIVQSEYKTASDEVNQQIDNINNIVKKYDDKAMVIGEAPCTKDLISITDNDFKVVNYISIGVIFFIILFVFKSAFIPVLLVTVIEFAIFINLGIPYYTNTSLPFIASIVIGTIQLGATVDYAILMTNRYKKERIDGHTKLEAVQIALTTSANSIIVSALGFFAATFGVGLYSNIDMISALCSLMARGAIVSMLTVLFILPSMLMVFDKPIIYTTIGMKKSMKEGK